MGDVGKKKVLIVDEDPDVRAFVQAALEDEGYEFVIATDGNVAIAKATSEKPDVVIMDVQMPNRDGLSALYHLRQEPETKSIPVILLTGVAETTGVRFTAESVEEFMGERPDVFIDKPAEPEELRNAVRDLLARGES